MEKHKVMLLLLAVCCFFEFLFPKVTAFGDTIGLGQSINGNQTLISPGQLFELGFFSPISSNIQYIGIWYKNIPAKTVVWVANRDNPLINSSGSLILSDNGNIVLLSGSGSLVWSSNFSHAAQSPVAQLLDTGNFVLRDSADGDKGNYLWQSFDYPCDSLLPGMKFGWDRSSGLNRHLTSWKSSADPSSGEFTYTVDHLGLPQLVLRRGSAELFRSGPWFGTQFSGQAVLTPNTVFEPSFVSKEDEVYYSYETVDNIPSRFFMSPSGQVQHYSWTAGHWNLLFTVQGDRCDNYGLCGSFGFCDISNATICNCIRGFKPRSLSDWNVLDWSGGCVPRNPNVCGNGEGFVKLTGVKLPDASEFLVHVSMSIEDCRSECLRNCSCAAYSKMVIPGRGNGCVTWYKELLDIRIVADVGQDLYVRVAASELELDVHVVTDNRKRNVAIVAAMSLFTAALILASISWFVIWFKRRNLVNQHCQTVGRVESQRDDDLELPLYDFSAIKVATNNFSALNKIGEGGFGPVYKGEFPCGQEVAIKRLGENSGQGLREFKNEVILIAKLQHRNLVKLLGCCIQADERMLIYEYMPNSSLDSLIFADETPRQLLNWQKRLDIVIGIARGLLYLHRDSRLRIIHRDLKASNILLDGDLNPKISDFGMARMFGGDQIEANTKRIVGTYGYMPPEYAIDGHFSLKSDVFSFGVILVEIISGKKNRGFVHSDHKLNLVGHAWKLWMEGRALELVDESLEKEYPENEVLRCIQVGLLCVQQRAEDRPTMPSVLLMLDSETTVLAEPGRPGFYAERCLSETDSSSMGANLMSYEMTVTLIQGR